VTESEFQESIIDIAHQYGWRVAHFRPARTERGWVTPVAADGAGFPDLVLVHAAERRCLFVEVKSRDGRLTKEQTTWLADLHAARMEVELWRPENWPSIVDRLSFGKARVA
jgi:hypothetical protein